MYEFHTGAVTSQHRPRGVEEHTLTISQFWELEVPCEFLLAQDSLDEVVLCLWALRRISLFILSSS